MRIIDQTQYVFTIPEITEALADWVYKSTGQKVESEDGKPLNSNFQVDPARGLLVWTVYPYAPEAPPGGTIQ